MIYADQWRHDQFDSPVSYTPHVDALAAQGTIFHQHYTQTLPCSPSRASIYTGLYAQNHRVRCNKSPLANRHKTIGQYLRESGYRPTLFGYTDTVIDPTHLHPNDPYCQARFEILPGFEDGCHQPDSHPYRWWAHVRKQGFDFDKNDHKDIYRCNKNRPNGNGGVAGYPTYYDAKDSDTAFITDALLGWQREQQQGWCAMLSYLRPHNPTVASEPYNSLVDPNTLALPKDNGNVERQKQVHDYIKYALENSNASTACHPDLSGKVCDVSDADKQSLRAVHLGLMAEVDDNIGRVFQQLKDLGEWDNTLILFSADHGEQMFDHNLRNQFGFYDEAVQVPFIIKLPADATVPKNNEVTAFTEAVDTVPTILDCLNRDIPTHLDGHSLLPFIKGESPKQWRQSVRWEINFEQVLGTDIAKKYDLKSPDCVMSIYKDKHFKHVFIPKMPTVLFDLNKDPLETVNVAAHADYAPIERHYLHKQLTHYVQHLDRSVSRQV